MGTPSNTAKELLRATALDNAASKSKLEDDLEQDGFARSSADRSENLYGTSNEITFIEQDSKAETQADNGEIQVSIQALPSGSEVGWHLYNINADDVWNDYTGRGVIVAVVDNGWHSYNHPDLNDNIRFDLTDNTAVNGLDHGQNTMGLIGAEANGSQTVGVAYNADLTGELWTTQGILDATGYADVINNSWTFKNPLTPISQSAIDGAVTTGRGGLGSVVVFSAGNYRTEDIGGNIMPMQSSPHAIVVGAMDMDGTETYFSSGGSSLLITAPGVGLFTTHGATGTMANFAGTSGSAPIVSGVAALILEANMDLGFRDVQEIMSLSAQHNDSGGASWAYNGDAHWNGGGRHFSHDHGYGNIDARAAVRLAETWDEQSTMANMQTVTKSVTVNAGIPDAGSAITSSTTVTAGENIAVESVVLNMDINGHGEVGDLIIRLTSPNGTVATIMDTPMFGSTGVAEIDYNFGAQNFRGEEAAGLWTVSVQDVSGGNIGTWADWTLTINGDTLDNNDVYFYSNDFAGMGGGRTTLSDASGTDTINASMVTGNMNINMNAGTTSSIAGNTLTIAGGTIIENVYAGDGNDTITGNTADNLIWGGRGSDTIDGGDGNDIAEFLEDLADYTISFVGSAMHAVIGSTTDIINNVENFIFNGASYTYNYLRTTFGPPSNDFAPTASGNDATIGINEVVLASTIISANDADGNTLTYEVWDSGRAWSSGYFELNGSKLATQQGHTLTEQQFSELNIVGGSDNGTETMWIRVSDGTFTSAWDSFTLTTSGAVPASNTVPTVTANNLTLGESESVQLSTIVTASDADGDALTYEVWDGNSNAQSGYIEFSGSKLSAGRGHTFSEADFLTLNLIGGTKNGSEYFWVRVSDGDDTTAWQKWTLTTDMATIVAGGGNNAPTVSADNFTLARNDSVLANTIITASDADGDELTYEVWDGSGSAGSSYLELNGSKLGAGSGHALTQAEFDSLMIVAGPALNTEKFWVRVSDGTVTTAWDRFDLTTVDTLSLGIDDLISDDTTAEQDALDTLEPQDTVEPPDYVEPISATEHLSAPADELYAPTDII
ncbi:MAG TPA: hypothetical protein EYG18_09555 [Micavibrio sp.]|nr:hypothetical protein [Micavibrio sp.]HIL29503.1 hypothetical protein [Micavibrio sp.]